MNDLSAPQLGTDDSGSAPSPPCFTELLDSLLRSVDELADRPSPDGDASMRLIEASYALHRAALELAGTTAGEVEPDVARNTLAVTTPREVRGRPRDRGSDATVEVALLDADGVICWVNEAWTSFSSANGGDASRTGVGANFLGVCAAAGEDPTSRTVLETVQAACRGEVLAPIAIEVPCHGDGRSRWYEMFISSRLGDDGAVSGASVTLVLAGSQLRSRPAPTAS